MIIINRNKRLKQYRPRQVPNFSHRRAVRAWNYVEQMNAELVNIKSIDIQVKDIRQMFRTHNPTLVSLYARLKLMGEYSNDEYINIPKNRPENVALLFEILKADWILKLESLETKTEDELESERLFLQKRIEDQKKKTKSSNKYYLDYIELLEYKLACLEDYMSKRINNSQDGPALTRKLSTDHIR